MRAHATEIAADISLDVSVLLKQLEGNDRLQPHNTLIATIPLTFEKTHIPYSKLYDIDMGNGPSAPKITKQDRAILEWVHHPTEGSCGKLSETS